MWIDSLSEAAQIRYSGLEVSAIIWLVSVWTALSEWRYMVWTLSNAAKKGHAVLGCSQEPVAEQTELKCFSNDS